MGDTVAVLIGGALGVPFGLIMVRYLVRPLSRWLNRKVKSMFAGNSKG